MQQIPKSVVRLFDDYYINVPELYLLVEELHALAPGPKIELAATAAISFLSEFEGGSKMYATYATFHPGDKNSLRRAVTWLEEAYVHKLYRGKVITDFDETVHMFEGAPLSLSKILNNKLDMREVSKLMSDLHLKGDTAHLAELLEGVRLNIANPDREAPPVERQIVISLHGIRTRGAWQKDLSPALAERGFIPTPLDYGFFRAIQLVLPFMRNAKIKWFLDAYTAVTTRRGRRPPSIIAHSLGTYLVARTLEKHAEVKFDRIIFCGSIVDRRYSWTTIFGRDQATRVMNDYGAKDFWAKAAQWVVNDAGPSGAKGFEDKAEGRVVERFRPEFRHSDFFYGLNYENIWIPFLNGNDPPADVITPRRPVNWRFRILLTVIILGLLALLFIVAPRLRTPHQPPPALGALLKTVPLTGSVGFEQEPSFSPDGSEIVYTWGDNAGTRSIYLKRLGASTPLRLTSEVDGNVQSPAWSSDGERIAYVRPVGDKAQIWEVPSLKGPVHKLGEILLYPAIMNRHPGLSSSPNGLYLAAPNGDSADAPFGIFLFSTKTSAWRRLTTATYADLQPSFSPDGQQIAFVRATTLGVEDLYTVPVVGGDPLRLTFDQKTINGAAWTPDGREIVFASNRSGNFALWRINSSGGNPQAVGVTADFLANPSISRGGNRLAYVQESANTNIWSLSISPAGNPVAPPIKLISSSKEESSPQYSPNGQKIVFVSTRSGSSEIWLCERDGSNPIPLTKFGGPITGTPRWSPDGQEIVFDSRPSGQSRIYRMRVDDIGTHYAVTSGPGDDTVPSWSADGNWIFFASTRSGAQQIWKVPVAGGEPVQLTLHGGFAPLPSRDGRFLYYAKDPMTAGLWRVPVDGGAESLVMNDLQVSFWGQWKVTDSGICFMSPDGNNQGGIQFFRFATRTVEHIFTPEKPPDPWTDGLDVSPDGRTVLYTQVDQRTTNVMLIDNFH